MLSNLSKLFGNPNERKIKRIEPILDDIAVFEEELSHLSDEELQGKTEAFKQQLADRPRDPDAKKDYKLEQEALDLLLPEAFAVVREAGKRVLGMRHYDTQMIGGYVLHKGSIAEMRTGEGKTLVATLPAYLNALTGKGVHIVTVNDYLAKRDSEWMGQLFRFLGLSVGVVLSGQRGFGSHNAKAEAYRADITYGTNNEFGFDYLRDNMATSLEQVVQRPFNYAVIDEVDSILIDEARTPLIISGRLEQSAETYNSMAKVAPLLEKETHYEVDEKARNVILNEEGIDKAQELLGLSDLFDPAHNLAHYLLCALKAKELFRKDIEYVVKDDQVVIVDEFTGRLMEGRRWSDGQHQAVEAKEGVSIQDETQTLASITFQNLFRLYPKLSGMTGTAMTEVTEFGKIYNLEVTAIPTNRLDVREDMPDLIYKNESVKFFKVTEAIVDMHLQGRPVLVGTTSIEKSEVLSLLLSQPEALAQHAEQKAERLLKWLKDSKKPELEAALEPMLANISAQTAETMNAMVEAQPELAKWGDFLDSWLALSKTLLTIEVIAKGIPHKVLNAKQHENEAMIVAQAGRKGAVTIATNMAGRGTDILLGGNAEFLARAVLMEEGRSPLELEEAEWKAMIARFKEQTEAEKEEVMALGGLHIIGTERHESRRIDNQLRGRAGRQGDPGSTQFFLSLQDSLMRLFGGDKIVGLMDFLAVDETLPITAGLVTRTIEGAQRKVEAYHFDMRKNVLQYDDVLTEQRKLIYAQRHRVLHLKGLRESVQHMVCVGLGRFAASHLPPDEAPEERSAERLANFRQHLANHYPVLADFPEEPLKTNPLPHLVQELQVKAIEAYDRLEAELSALSQKLSLEHGVSLNNEASTWNTDEELDEAIREERRHPLRQVERNIVLSIVDAKWIEYLHRLDALREGIGLRAYGQKDPLIEYKREAYSLFQTLTYEIQDEVASLLFRSQIEIEMPQTQQAQDWTQLPFMTDETGSPFEMFQQGEQPVLLSGVDEEGNPQQSETRLEGAIENHPFQHLTMFDAEEDEEGFDPDKEWLPPVDSAPFSDWQEEDSPNQGMWTPRT